MSPSVELRAARAATPSGRANIRHLGCARHLDHRGSRETAASWFASACERLGELVASWNLTRRFRDCARRRDRQLYVAATARGGVVAAALLGHGEEVIAARI
jgi:hypothetical protein